MSITITQIRSAVSINAANTTINNDEVMALIGTDFAAYVAPTSEELAATAAAEIRSQRDQLLLEVDAFVGNPLRWAALSSDKQAEWVTYRTALLNVPQQSGFPNVTWPTLGES